MDHPEARARLAEIALEPDRLSRLARVAAGASNVAGDADVADHVATCPECSTEVDAWQRTVRLLDAATAGVEGSPRSTLRAISVTDLRVDPDRRAVRPPGSDDCGRPFRTTGGPDDRALHRGLVGRERRPRATCAAGLAGGRSGRGHPGHRGRVPRRPGPAARRGAVRSAGARHRHVAARRDFQDPAHATAVLSSSTGAAAGSASWGPSTGVIVVLTSALQAPPSGFVYPLLARGRRGPNRHRRHELQRINGVLGRRPGRVGQRRLPGGRLGVSLEPAAGGVDGEPILVAAF